MKSRALIVMVALLLACAGIVTMSKHVSAEGGEFSLQISPSPLVLTLKPGQTETVDLKVRNTGPAQEKLKIAPRSFRIDKDEKLVFNDTETPEVAGWLKFDQPNFTVDPGQTITEKITISIPKEAGFSYAFALVINRQKEEMPSGAVRQLKGSIALFTLLNIDRPGAVRKLDVVKFSTSQPIYEYLPATFNITLKNTGNTIVQPSGNVFIQRNSKDTSPIGTLPVNQAQGYILPGVSRTLKADWADGFQVLHTTTDASGVSKKELTWNWNNLSHIPFGRYTAKLVAVYNDGQRDVPIIAEVSFWVIPWKLLLGLLVVLVLIGMGLWSFIRKASKIKRRKHVRFSK